MLYYHLSYLWLDLSTIDNLWTILAIILGFLSGFRQFLARYKGYWQLLRSLVKFEVIKEITNESQGHREVDNEL